MTNTITNTMNQIIQLLTQILMLVEELVQRQTKQEVVDDKDSVWCDDSFPTKLPKELGLDCKTLKAPYEFMGSRSEQWSQRYRGLLMDFEGAMRHIAELKSENAELNARVNKARDIIAKANDKLS